MIVDLKKITIPLMLVIPLVTAVGGFAGAVLVDRDRVGRLEQHRAELSAAVDELRAQRSEDHTQVEVIRADVRYTRESVERIEQAVQRLEGKIK